MNPPETPTGPLTPAHAETPADPVTAPTAGYAPVPVAWVTCFLDAADACPCGLPVHGPCCVRRGLAAVRPLWSAAPPGHEPGS